MPDTDITTDDEAITLDCAATGLTLHRHPLALLRSRLNQRAWHSADQLAQLQDSSTARARRIVKMRQQPETAKDRGRLNPPAAAVGRVAGFVLGPRTSR